MRRKSLVAGVVATAIAVVAVGSASSAPQAKTYSRVTATAHFEYVIDYGSNPDSVFNGKYYYSLRWRVSTIVVHRGRSLSAMPGLMLADGGVEVIMDMTEWRGPSSRRPLRCSKPGSRGGRGRLYDTHTRTARFSGGGGVGVSGGRLSVNPGRAIVWSIGCAATEGLERHELPGGPTGYLRAPNLSQAFTISCSDSYSHDWDPAADVPGAHTFDGYVDVTVRFTPFPSEQLPYRKKHLRDLAGESLSGKTPLPGPDVKKTGNCS